jgi:hypothetical protein
MMHISEVRNQESLREMAQDFREVGVSTGMVVPLDRKTKPQGDES